MYIKKDILYAENDQFEYLQSVGGMALSGEKKKVTPFMI